MIPEGLRYERYRPSAPLAPYVEHFWLVAAPYLAETRREILIPNGRPNVLVCIGEAGSRLSVADGSRQENASNVSGVMTVPVVIEQQGANAYVGAQLTPFGLSGFPGRRMLVDTSVPLGDWLGDDGDILVERMRALPLGEAPVRLLETALVQHLRPIEAPVLETLSSTIAAIEEGAELPDVDDLGRRLGLGYTALYRLFRTHIGVSPKRFMSIIRYYRLVGGLLQGGADGGLAQLALLQGYYDQAHATKAFRRFTGVSPTAFARTLNGIARLMHRPTSR